jgi:signal transduction histidine kinase
MIQDLLDTFMVQMGESIHLKASECEILTIVKSTIADMNRKDSSRVRIEGSPVWGYWDGDALTRAIENLLSNAVKYASSGTPITIRIAAENERMSVTVHNLGEPIPTKDQEQLFQVFRRSEAAKSSGKRGWGIGLAFVRSVAEGHGGSIEVDSSKEQGTAFMVDIPVDARPFIGAPLAAN